LKLDDEEEIFLLSDGSLFFLSSKLRDTALYNCENEGIMSKPAALIVDNKRKFEEVKTLKLDEDNTLKFDEDKTLMFDEDKPKFKVEVKTEVNEGTTEKIHVEVIKDEISSMVYIISIAIVFAMTILILAGAAFIFTKIKQMPQVYYRIGIEKEVHSSMVSCPSTLSSTDSWSSNGVKLATFEPYREICHHYARPVNNTEEFNCHLTLNAYYASTMIVKNMESCRNLSPVYIMPKDVLNKM